MILIKYNEIMSNATVDPEMKSRVMAAVSKAIREQPGGAVVTELKKDIDIDDSAKPVRRKKAKKVPIPLIASIAAGVLVLLGIGALGIAGYFGTANKAATAIEEHNSEALYLDTEINSALGGDEVKWDAAESQSTTEADTLDNNRNTLSGDKNLNTKNHTYKSEETTTTLTPPGGAVESTEQVMGDERLDKISKALPFKLMGTGSSSYGENIAVEIFLGTEGEKALLYAAPEGTDLMKEIYTSKYEGTGSTTPGGTAVTLYRIPFNNVKALSKGETSADVNAALFTKGGKTYLLLFSDIYPVDAISKVIDAF